MTPGGVLLRENRMYGCENSVHKEPGLVEYQLRIVSVLLEKSSKSFHGNVAIYTSCDCESWQACTNDIKSSIERSRRHLECLRTIFSEVAWKVFNFLV